jgi:hypothetical protein
MRLPQKNAGNQEVLQFASRENLARLWRKQCRILMLCHKDHENKDLLNKCHVERAAPWHLFQKNGPFGTY